MMIGRNPRIAAMIEAGMMSFPMAVAAETGGSHVSRILLLANDCAAANGVQHLLGGTGCTVIGAASVATALDLARHGDFDAIVVDFRPDFFGYDAVCQLRVAKVELPILFVSARSTPEAGSRALGVGADDVVVLPLTQQGLMARLQRLPAAAAPSRSVLQLGALEIDPDARDASIDGATLALNPREYTVLEVLATRNGAAVAKDALNERLAGTAGTGPADAIIAGLRRKLARWGAGSMIRTVRGLGYAIGAGNGASLRWNAHPMMAAAA